VIISLKQKKKIQKEEKGYPFTAKKKVPKRVRKKKGKSEESILIPKILC